MTEELTPYNAPVATVPQQNQALVEIEQQRAMAEVQSAIVLAKKFPRNQMEALDKILVACQRPGLAEQSLYSYARGGTEITGPSIRLAEAIAQNWGNLQFGIKELDQRAGESTVEAFCWDMETNVRQVKAFQVKHERHTKKGSYALSDPRDIYETVANQGARRLRACILGIIPGDVIDSAVSQCEETMKAKFAPTPELINKWEEAFFKFGVTKEQIEKRIQRRMDAITAAQIVSLQKIYNSMKDGMSVPTDWFEVAPETVVDASATLKDKIKAAKGKTQQAPPSILPAEAAKLPTTEPLEEMAPKECPDREGQTMTQRFCDACKSRLGCPVWS